MFWLQQGNLAASRQSWLQLAQRSLVGMSSRLSVLQQLDDEHGAITREYLLGELEEALTQLRG